MTQFSQGSSSGWHDLALWLYRAVGRLITFDVTRLLHLDKGDLREPRIDPAFEIRLLTPLEVAEFARDPANDLDASLSARMTCGRDLCCAALDGEQLAAYAWFALGSIEASMHRGRRPRSGVAVSYPRSMALVYKAFTRPEYRGRHLYPAVLAHGLHELAPRDVSQLLDTAEWMNGSALTACRRLGFRELGTTVRVALGPLAFTIRPLLATKYGVLFGRQAKVHPRVPQANPEYASREDDADDELLVAGCGKEL